MDLCVEYSSIFATVAGIKFYSGLQHLHPMMHVVLRREPNNVKDRNAYIVATKAGVILGHLDRRTAAVLTPIVQRMTQLHIKRYVLASYYQPHM